MKRNPKIYIFYGYANSKLRTKHGISELTSESGEFTVDTDEKAILFNKFFNSVFTVENMDNIPVIHQASIMAISMMSSLMNLKFLRS